MARHLTRIDRVFWRMMFTDWVNAVLLPARSPEGRFHYNGQPALYLSETPEGCVVASKRYIRASDPPRRIYPLRVTSGRIVDLRDGAATTHYNIDVTHRAAHWQKIRATGAPSPTWTISDRVRALNLDGILYASRSHPGMTHLTLFTWNNDGNTTVTPNGPGHDWAAYTSFG